MNHEQWTKLREATNGHTPGPWLNEMTFRHMAKQTDATLAAAAPALLAEVERLRGWLAYIRQNTPWDIMTRDRSFDALSGAEVPE